MPQPHFWHLIFHKITRVSPAGRCAQSVYASVLLALTIPISLQKRQRHYRQDLQPRSYVCTHRSVWRARTALQQDGILLGQLVQYFYGGGEALCQHFLLRLDIQDFVFQRLQKPLLSAARHLRRIFRLSFVSQKVGGADA